MKSQDVSEIALKGYLRFLDFDEDSVKNLQIPQEIDMTDPTLIWLSTQIGWEPKRVISSFESFLRIVFSEHRMCDLREMLSDE